MIRPGDVVHIPAGVSHFHGATENSRFQQIVIYDRDWQAKPGDKAHTGAVTAEEYGNIRFVAESGTVDENKDFL